MSKIDPSNAALIELHRIRDPYVRRVMGVIAEFCASCGVTITVDPPAVRAELAQLSEQYGLAAIDIGVRHAHGANTIPGPRTPVVDVLDTSNMPRRQRPPPVPAPAGTYKDANLWDDDTKRYGTRTQRRRDGRG